MSSQSPSSTMLFGATTARATVPNSTQANVPNIGSAQMLALAFRHHQAGNLGDAEILYRRVLQAEPRNVDALHLLGLIANRVGKHELAIELIQAALREKPDFAEAHCNLGVALQLVGQPAEAAACFRQALRLKPDYVDAHNNLGNALLKQDEPAEALASLQEALRLRPGHAEALANLGLALQRLGKLDEAIASYQQALRHMPAHADAHNNLGVALKEQGKLEEAAASYNEALRHMPSHAEAHNNLGILLQEQGKLDEAAASMRQALRYNPDYANAHYNLGCLFLMQEKWADAAASLKQALRIMPHHVGALNNLGTVLQSTGKPEEAKVVLERALNLQPDYPTARCNLGGVLQQMGDFAGAEQAYRTVLRDHPQNDQALWQLATLLAGKLPTADRAVLEQRLAKPDLDDTDRSRLLFGLAQVCDATGEFAQAAAQLQEANALALAVRRRKEPGFDVEGHARFVANLMAVFAPEFFARMQGFGLDSERPVFIVGLPRSGTTLTEQILAAHSQVFGAGELPLARVDSHALGMQPMEETAVTTLPGLQRDTVRRVAQWHLDQLWTLNPSAARVVDKMTDNYMYLGMLATLFPRAKFIHCRRDLRDVAVSCWMTDFSHIRWANDPKHIAVRFREYQRLMEHWHAVLPVDVLEVDYEETVADLPGVARRLLAWCGLEWEPACLSFHESKRPVRTSSVIQVRQPIYSRSVGRWRNYEQSLDELFTALKPLLERDDAEAGCPVLMA